MTPQSSDLDTVWRALANPVRREILDRLRAGPLSTSDLVLAFPDISRFAVMQHLGVLEEARLVIPHRFGRLRLNCLNAVPLRQATRRWLDRFDEGAADGLIRLKARLEGTVDASVHHPTPAAAQERLRLDPEAVITRRGQPRGPQAPARRGSVGRGSANSKARRRRDA